MCIWRPNLYFLVFLVKIQYLKISFKTLGLSPLPAPKVLLDKISQPSLLSDSLLVSQARQGKGCVFVLLIDKSCQGLAWRRALSRSYMSSLPLDNFKMLSLPPWKTLPVAGRIWSISGMETQVITNHYLQISSDMCYFHILPRPFHVNMDSTMYSTDFISCFL